MYNRSLPKFPLGALRHMPFSVTIDRATFILCVIYLAVPNLIFASGYLRSFPALLSIVMLIAGYRSVLADFFQGGKNPYFTHREHLWILVWALILTVVSGAGALLPQAWDYYKHNSIWEILVIRPWPVMLFPGKPLVYYIGYYLPAACLARIFGPETLNFFSFCWQFLGIYLILRLSRCAFGQFRWYIPLLMLAVFPIDLFYATAKFGIVEGRCYISNPHLYDLLFHFDAMARAVRWVPQHFIPAFVATIILLSPQTKKYSPFWAAQILIFSPFVVIGLSLLVLLNCCRLLYAGRTAKLLNFTNLFCSIIPAIPVMLYLIPARTGDNLMISGLIFQSAAPGRLCLNWIAFFMNVFLIWYLLFLPGLFGKSGNKKGSPWLFPVCNLVFVLILTSFRMGQFDFPARTLIPPYILMMLWVIGHFIHSHEKSVKTFMIVLCAFGSICGAYDYCCMVKGMILRPQEKFYRSQKSFFESGLHCEQYIDSDQKLFYRFFSKNGKFF